MSQTKIQPPMAYFVITVFAENLPQDVVGIELTFFENEMDVIDAAHKIRKLGIDDRIVRVTEYVGETAIQSWGMQYFCNAAIIQ